jgi:hypothetical protein
LGIKTAQRLTRKGKIPTNSDPNEALPNDKTEDVVIFGDGHSIIATVFCSHLRLVSG